VSNVIDSFTGVIVEILCRASKNGAEKVPVLTPFLEYDKLIQRGEALCTNWIDAPVVGPVCRSIEYVLKYLEVKELITIDKRDGWIHVNPKLCRDEVVEWI